jgi:hypothetical protein
MRNTHYRTWNIAKLKKMENETLKLCDLEYVQRHSKTWKMWNTPCRTWNMARKLTNKKNETQKLFDMETLKKREKWEMHTVGPGIWRENWPTSKMWHTQCRTWNMAKNSEKCEKWVMYTVGPRIWWDTLK